MDLRKAQAWTGPLAILSLASISCVLFTAFVPPLLDPALVSRLPIIGGLAGDLPVYWLRFTLSFLLLGIAPLTLSLLAGYAPDALGLNFHAPLLRKPLFWASLPIAMIIGAIGAASPDLGGFYPYSRDLIARVARQGLAPFFAHFAAYFFLYYLPWEFFFRGFLLLGLLAWAQKALAKSGSAPSEMDSAAAMVLVAAIVLFQTMPSAMLHVGHPLSEQLSAVPAGIIFGILAWKTRSIIPGLLVHASIGFGTDFFIVLKGAGYFG